MKPIFIVGAPRSGNTLFRLIMSSHSCICIPPESGFLHYLWPIYIAGNANIADNIVTKLFSDHKFQIWGLSRAEVDTYTKNSIDKCYDEFISGIYGLYLKKVKKENAQWGDKNPLYIGIIGRILELFPNAWIVLLVREPLSIYGSLKRVNFFGRDTEIAVNDYYRRIRCVADAIVDYQHSPNVIMVNYASFVSDPRKNTETLINKLGYNFEHTMLDFHNNQTFISEMLQSKIKFHENLLKPISDSFVSPENYGLEQPEIQDIETKLREELRVIRNFINNNQAL